MSGIYGQYSSISSASVRLQSSLESRLRQRLEQAGSTIYKLTWKQKVTPQGWSYCQRVASVPRIKETDSGTLQSVWMTPKASDGKFATPRTSGRPMHRSTHLQTQAIANLTNHAGSDLPHMLTGWPTPQARDWKESQDHQEGWDKRLQDKGASHSVPITAHQISAWPTPMTADNRDRGSFDDPAIQRRLKIGKSIELSMLAHSVTSGQGANSYIAETGKSVKYQLNPRFSLWLMGYPIAWAYCAERVTPLSRKSRQK